jgi:hypothetical protein
MPETKIKEEVKNEWVMSNQQLNPETPVQNKNRSSHVLPYPPIAGTEII